MKDDGEIRKGRYLRKSSTLFDKVKVEPFSFADICKAKVTYPDNPSSNILHTRYHRPEELEQTIKATNKVFETLVNPANQGPVIYPRDFTDDWLEEKRKARRRNSSRYEDEDEFEMALEAEEEERRRQSEAARIRERKIANGEIDESPAAANQVPMQSAAAAATPAASQAGAPALEPPTPDREPSNANAPSSAQAGQQAHQLEQLQSPQKANAPVGQEVGEAIKNFTKPEAHVPASTEASAPPDLAAAALSGDGFQQMMESLPHPESSQPAPAPGLSAEEQEALVKEAQAVGFEQGYQEGLVKAQEAAEAAQDPLVSALNKTLSELAALKSQVLTRAQDNFFEITKALCESVLDQELTSKPEAFHHMISKVISEVCQNDEYRVRLHPDDYKRLEAAQPGRLGKGWTSDERVEAGHFVIDAGDQVVRSSVQKIVTSLLAGADLQLFSPKQNTDESDAAQADDDDAKNT